MKHPKTLIALLMKLAASDNQVAQNESQFIRAVAKQVNLSVEDWEILTQNYDSFPIDIPKIEKDRAVILYHALFLMKIDGEIAKEEEELCHKIGLRLGFRPELVNELISIIKSHLNRSIPVNLMINAIKKYQN